MNQRYTGLAVLPTTPPSMNVIVQPGTLSTLEGVIEVPEAATLPIREGGQRRFDDQAYTIRGEGTVSPSWWNGEDIRGSGGAPYQRMVPGSLAVFSKSRDIRYVPDEDYTYDYYWGTIKRHPNGRIADGQQLSIDYRVWLCRYDAIVLREDGSLAVVEGDDEAPDSRELHLPEPPVVKQGHVLGRVFTGWGQDRIYGGGSAISGLSSDFREVRAVSLGGRYEDMVRRTYVAEVAPDAEGGSPTIRFGATGEDYGTGAILSETTVRWTQPEPALPDLEHPLTLQSAYGRAVDWGLSLTFAPRFFDSLAAPLRFGVDAVPEMIFDMRHLLGESSSAGVRSIPIERTERLSRFRSIVKSGGSARIAFFGESFTRAGLYPYLTMSRIRERYPDARIYSSNIGVGGESSDLGIHRLDREVLNLSADVVVLEYFINDACSGLDEGTIEGNLRSILTRILESGAACVIVMGNGVNPLFTRNGSKRNFRKHYGLYRRLAAEFDVAFVGGYEYFANLHRYGRYFLTEFKGNMVNHTFGNVDFTWGPFDRLLSDALAEAFCRE